MLIGSAAGGSPLSAEKTAWGLASFCSWGLASAMLPLSAQFFWVISSIVLIRTSLHMICMGTYVLRGYLQNHKVQNNGASYEVQNHKSTPKSLKAIGSIRGRPSQYHIIPAPGSLSLTVFVCARFQKTKTFVRCREIHRTQYPTHQTPCQILKPESLVYIFTLNVQSGSSLPERLNCVAEVARCP